MVALDTPPARNSQGVEPFTIEPSTFRPPRLFVRYAVRTLEGMAT